MWILRFELLFSFGYFISRTIHHFLRVRCSIWKCLLMFDLRVFKLYLNFKYFLHFSWLSLNLDISALFIFSCVLDAELGNFRYVISSLKSSSKNFTLCIPLFKLSQCCFTFDWRKSRFSASLFSYLTPRNFTFDFMRVLNSLW